MVGLGSPVDTDPLGHQPSKVSALHELGRCEPVPAVLVPVQLALFACLKPQLVAAVVYLAQAIG